MKKTLHQWYARHRAKPFVRFLDQFLYRAVHHEVSTTGGQLAYFLILSIFPFLIALLNVLNFTPLASRDFIDSWLPYLPDAAQGIFLSFLGELNTASSASLLSLSLLGGLWSASSGIRQLIRAINKAFSGKETRSFLKLSLLAFTFTVALIIMIILLLFTQIFGARILDLVAQYLHPTEHFMNLASNLSKIIPLVYMFLTFCALYRFSPSIAPRALPRKSVLPGAIFATLGIVLATMGFTFYVTNFGKYTITYGSLAGVILLFLWLYLMAIIIVLGGEVNATLYSFKEESEGLFFEDLLGH